MKGRAILHLLRAIAVAALTLAIFTWPGLALVRDLADPALAGPGIPARALRQHRALTPRIEVWARERVATGRAAHAPLHDVPTTEWPMFTAVFYLMATEELEAAWRRGELEGEEPLAYSRGAVDAARDLLVDPAHHTWVRTHWGDGYLHRENVFFRSLLVGGLASHEAIVRDGSSVPMLRDQVETLAADLDRSELGVLHDYPGECYPIDVLAAIGWIRRADAILGTDHSAFVARSLRAFEPPHTDGYGLVRYRVDLPSGAEVQPSRGIGTSWILAFAPDLWPDRAREWYRRYDGSFWQERGWASGYREYAPGTEAEWTFEIDAGAVLDGFGTAASAFGIAAARRNGRFDRASTLSAQMSAASWELPGGTLLWPRAFSHAIDAPYLGEAALLHFVTVQPAPGVAIVRGGSWPGLVWLAFLVYFGGTLFGAFAVRAALRAIRQSIAHTRAASAYGQAQIAKPASIHPFSATTSANVGAGSG
jgi:hypothetical protein